MTSSFTERAENLTQSSQIYTVRHCEQSNQERCWSLQTWILVLDLSLLALVSCFNISAVGSMVGSLGLMASRCTDINPLDLWAGWRAWVVFSGQEQPLFSFSLSAMVGEHLENIALEDNLESDRPPCMRSYASTRAAEFAVSHHT